MFYLQRFDFNVNTEADENGDYLVHSATREGENLSYIYVYHMYYTDST